MADRVVIVDGDSLTAKLMCFALEDAGFEVAVSMCGEDAFDLVLTRETSLLILDINLPDTDGFALLSELRARRYAGPSIFVTARGGIADKLRGFALGAEDYIVKPFEPLELVARVACIIRRVRRADLMTMGTIVRAGDAELSIGELSYRSGAIDATSLTPTEMRILEVLMRNPTVAISRERLIERIWGYDFIGETNRVDVYIRRIRCKIEPDPDRPRYLHTVRGIGYLFRTEGSIQVDLSATPRKLKVVQAIPA